MMLLMFSLAGVPPTVGFYAKLSVFASRSWRRIWRGWRWRRCLFSLIGAFYYLRIVKLMYFDQPIDIAPIKRAWICAC